MIRKLFILTCVLAPVMTLLSFTPTQDNKAKEILNKVSTKFKKMTTVKASFTYTLENKKDKIKDSQKGTLFLKGNKFKVIIAGREIYCDSKTLWVYLVKQKEVQVSTYQPNSSDFSPQTLFTIHEKGFDYKYVAEKLGVHEIELTPQDKTKKFFKVRLFVNKKTEQISKAIVYDKGGNIYTYEVNSMTPNVAMTDATFVFDKAAHPDVEVIE